MTVVSNYPKSKFFYLAEDFLQFFEIFSSSRHLLLFCYTDTIPNCNIQSRDMPLSRYTDNVFLCIYSKMNGMETIKCCGNCFLWIDCFVLICWIVVIGIATCLNMPLPCSTGCQKERATQRKAQQENIHCLYGPIYAFLTRLQLFS